MQLDPLFNDNQDPRIALGAGLSMELLGGLGKTARKARLYRQGVLLKEVNLTDRVAKRLFVVEAVGFGAKKSSLAEALGMSRQTIDNHLGALKYFGQEGLIQGYHVGASKDRRQQRQLHQEELSLGNKARKVEALRRQEREHQAPPQETFTFTFSDSAGKITEIAPENHPFVEEHDWERTRYAGAFLYLIPLITQWGWLRLVMGHCGEAYRIIMVFVLMTVANIRSLEQLKYVPSREAGVALGIKRLVSRTTRWEWFYDAARRQVSGLLLHDYFRHQLRSGLVGIAFWFTDGHLLPYTGKQRVHYAYNTQRRMPVPGRTGLVTCDGSGRIVDFEIQEGKGDLRAHLTALGNKWRNDLPPQTPVQVFDREGHGAAFFAGLVAGNCPFVTWDKHVDPKKLAAIEDRCFATEFALNGKSYGVFEGEKILIDDTNEAAEPITVTLRRIYLWNKTSKRRTCGLAWTGDTALTTEECARAILSRWGASENTFKHLKDRHPWHYHPGFKLVASDRQDIANPELKEKEIRIGVIKKGLSKLYRKLAKAKEVMNADGKPRHNSTRERLQQSVVDQEATVLKLTEEKKQLAPRVEVSTLEDYQSFKRIDNEGKYLFDFVTISVWNARKQMVEWLRPHFHAQDEVVDLFYAITKCHGWLKSTATEVTVRLEPLEQPRCRQAQEQLCRKLTSLLARTPNGKRLTVEVGEAPR